MSHFYTPWKRQKTIGFLTFSGGIEMYYWTKRVNAPITFVIAIINRWQFYWKIWLDHIRKREGNGHFYCCTGGFLFSLFLMSHMIFFYSNHFSSMKYLPYIFYWYMYLWCIKDFLKPWKTCLKSLDAQKKAGASLIIVIKFLG